MSEQAQLDVTSLGAGQPDCDYDQMPRWKAATERGVGTQQQCSDAVPMSDSDTESDATPRGNTKVVNYKSKPRRKATQKPVGSDQKRQAFSKRKRGMVLKSYQLYKLTDAKVFLFMVNDKGSSWAYASPGFGACLSNSHLKQMRQFAKLPSHGKYTTEVMPHPVHDPGDTEDMAEDERILLMPEEAAGGKQMDTQHTASDDGTYINGSTTSSQMQITLTDAQPLQQHMQLHLHDQAEQQQKLQQKHSLQAHSQPSAAARTDSGILTMQQSRSIPVKNDMQVLHARCSTSILPRSASLNGHASSNGPGRDNPRISNGTKDEVAVQPPRLTTRHVHNGSKQTIQLHRPSLKYTGAKPSGGALNTHNGSNSSALSIIPANTDSSQVAVVGATGLQQPIQLQLVSAPVQSVQMLQHDYQGQIIADASGNLYQLVQDVMPLATAPSHSSQVGRGMPLTLMPIQLQSDLLTAPASSCGMPISSYGEVPQIMMVPRAGNNGVDRWQQEQQQQQHLVAAAAPIQQQASQHRGMQAMHVVPAGAVQQPLLLPAGAAVSWQQLPLARSVHQQQHQPQRQDQHQKYTSSGGITHRGGGSIVNR